jgi:hypothetical protein
MPDQRHCSESQDCGRHCCPPGPYALLEASGIRSVSPAHGFRHTSATYRLSGSVALTVAGLGKGG